MPINWLCVRLHHLCTVREVQTTPSNREDCNYSRKFMGLSWVFMFKIILMLLCWHKYS